MTLHDGFGQSKSCECCKSHWHRAKQATTRSAAAWCCRLSRPVDPCEVEALSEHLGVTVDHQDRMKAYWPKVDLEEMAKNPAVLSGKVMNAAGFARSARQEAQRQTARVDQLIEQVNAGLPQ